MISFRSPKTKNKNNKIYFFLQFYFIITIFLISVAAYYIFTSWKFESTIIKFKNSVSKAGRYEIIYFPKIIYGSILSKFQKIDTINLMISYKNELKLEKYRSQAIKDNVLTPKTTAKNIKVKFENEDVIYNAKMRLKGGRTTHWREKKYSSYKAELKKDQFIFGMNKFSLSKPRMRNYIHEWLFHEMGKEFDLISLNYKFVNLSINGDNKGLYVIEEGFDKRLVEQSERRNGPIFSLHEELNMNYNEIDKSANSILEVYNKKFWLNENNIKLTKYASNKLNNFFLKRENKIENVINLEKWATLLAICDFLYTFHGAQIKSVRFYYNPIDGLFEPILFDGHRNRNNPNYNKWNQNYNNQIIYDYIYNHSESFYRDESLQWLKLFFDNEKFKILYFEKLKQISSEKFLNKFYKKREKKIKKINNQIYGDYYLFDNGGTYGPGFYFFSIKDFFYRGKKIREKISVDDKLTNTRFQAGIENKELIIKNFVRSQYYGLYEIRKLICSENIDLKQNDDRYKLIKYLNKSKTISEAKEKDFHNVLIKTKIDISKLGKKITNSCQSVEIYNKLNNKILNINIDKLNFNIFKPVSDSQEYQKFFLIKNDKIYIKNNKQIIDKNIYIPEKYTVIIKPGQEIVLMNNAFIFSKANWIVDGEDRVIKIGGSVKNLGGGILINSSKKKSYFNNVNFSHLSGIKKDKLENGFIILGSINFYNTSLELKNLEFNKINSEDALNIISSSFKINKIQFRENFSDSIDLDFSNGEINNVNFKNIGNDALDFSGSKVEVKNAKFENVGDKIISIGEDSDVKIINIIGKNSFLGIANKDGSIAKVKKINFDNVEYPIASYNKKFEYGISKIYVEDLKVLNFKKKWIIDGASEIFFRNKNVGEKIEDILPLIYNRITN